MWAVIPLKPLAQAKNRLSRLLTPRERHNLVKIMAEEVIIALRNSTYVENILITSKESYASDLATKYQLTLLNSEKDTDLNSAIYEAAQYLDGREIKEMLVVHGDIPLLNTKELDEIAAAHIALKETTAHHHAVTLVPDLSGTGSNLLICSPPTAIPFHYGENSLQRHQEDALQRQLPFQLIKATSIATDIDHPSDLALLLQTLRLAATPSLTLDYLEASGIYKKLIPLLPTTVIQTQPTLEEYSSSRIQVMA